MILAGGAGVYQPPPIVVGNTTEYQGNYQQAQQPGQGYPPPPYAHQQPPPYNPNFPPQDNNAGMYHTPQHTPYHTNEGSKDHLVNNEYVR